MGIAILTRGGHESITEKVTFEKIIIRGKGMSGVPVGKTVLDRGRNRQVGRTVP